MLLGTWDKRCYLCSDCCDIYLLEVQIFERPFPAAGRQRAVKCTEAQSGQRCLFGLCGLLAGQAEWKYIADKLATYEWSRIRQLVPNTDKMQTFKKCLTPRVLLYELWNNCKINFCVRFTPGNQSFITVIQDNFLRPTHKTGSIIHDEL